MNAYDEQAWSKGIGTGLGAGVGSMLGPAGTVLGAKVGNAIGTFAGSLMFKPATSLIKNDSFDTTVDPSYGYRKDAFGKGWSPGMKAVTEKPTTFSGIANTVSDFAPTLLGGMKDLNLLGNNPIKSTVPNIPSINNIGSTSEGLSKNAMFGQKDFEPIDLTNDNVGGQSLDFKSMFDTHVQNSYPHLMKDNNPDILPNPLNSPVGSVGVSQTNDNSKVIQNYSGDKTVNIDYLNNSSLKTYMRDPSMMEHNNQYELPENWGNPYSAVNTPNKLRYDDGGEIGIPPFEDYYKTIPKDKSDTTDYDLKKAYENLPYDQMKAFATSDVHLPDTYKKPNHPTFSNESIYSNDSTPGGQWTVENGKDVFIPSKINLQWNRNGMNFYEYMKKYEPNVIVKTIDNKFPSSKPNTYKLGGEIYTVPEDKGSSRIKNSIKNNNDSSLNTMFVLVGQN